MCGLFCSNSSLTRPDVDVPPRSTLATQVPPASTAHVSSPPVSRLRSVPASSSSRLLLFDADHAWALDRSHPGAVRSDLSTVSSDAARRARRVDPSTRAQNGRGRARRARVDRCAVQMVRSGRACRPRQSRARSKRRVLLVREASNTPRRDAEPRDQSSERSSASSVSACIPRTTASDSTTGCDVLKRL